MLGTVNSRDKSTGLRRRATNETALLAVLLFVGIVLMPIAIYAVGRSVFGAYGDAGFGGFFSMLSEKIRHGDAVAWFLVLSPYFAWQCLRLTACAWRAIGRAQRTS